MLYEVEVIADSNSPMDLNRVFDLLTDARPALRIVAPDPMGNDVWCDVTGWENGEPCPAMAALSEDSGEGVIMLIYGGEDGIRLRPADSPDDWDIAAPSQWGEACLMLGSDIRIEYAPSDWDYSQHPH